ILVILVLLPFAAYWSLRPRHFKARPELDPALLGERVAFTPTVPDNARPTGPAPPNMVWIPGGEFSMGVAEPPDLDEVAMKATLDSRPIHRVYVDGFYVDKTDVTNEEFARFVRTTGYLTVAERKPRAEDFPGAPQENLVAGSVVFSPPSHA